MNSMTPRQRQERGIYKAKAAQELAVDSQLDKSPRFLELVKDVKEGRANPDTIVSSISVAKNSNIFHKVCTIGDVRAMEKLVALGAAIDHPFLDKDPHGQQTWRPSEALPSTLTVLGLLCAEMQMLWF